MSSFQCEKCGKPILEGDEGYYTGCEHYPLVQNMIRTFRDRKRGKKPEPYQAPKLGDLWTDKKKKT